MTTDVERDFMKLPMPVRMSIVTALQAAIAAPTHFLSVEEAHDALLAVGFPEAARSAWRIGDAKQ